MSLSATPNYSFSGIQKGGNPTDPSLNRKQTTRKRRDRSGTRCVAALSAAQLAHKRSNDREAQRATRQRTKERIDRLERRIRELTDGSSSERELDEIQQRNYQLEKELTYLKDRMALRMHDITQWKIAKVDSEDRGRQLCRPRAVTELSTPFTPASQPSPSTMPVEIAYVDSVWEPAWCSPVYEEPYCESTASEASTCGSRKTGLIEMIPTTLAIPLSTTSWAEIDGENPLQPELSMPYRCNDSDSCSSSYIAARGPSTPVLGCDGSDALVSNNSTFVATVEADHGGALRLPNSRLQNAWTLPLRLSSPTGPFDVIILDLVQRQRSISCSNADEATIVGPFRPSMRPLLYPEQRNESHPISSVIANVLHKTAMRDLPDKAAVLYLLYKLAQWQILPTCESYHALPEWFTPRISQLLTPHPIWVSQLPWGKLRDKVIENLATYATEEFQYLYLRSLNINWTWRAVDAFVWSPGGEDVTLWQDFEDHVSTLANWSLDEPFVQRYPELRDYCRFTRDIVTLPKGQP